MRSLVTVLSLAALLAAGASASANGDGTSPPPAAAPAASAPPAAAPAASAPPAAAPTASAPASPQDAAAARWCAPELASLPGEVCAFLPAREAPGPRVLVIFLHGVVQPDSGWQWAQQRGAARAGARHGVAVMMPRGRRGIGPKTMEDWWCWPTASAAQTAHEDALIAEWDAARAELERRAGGRFERVLVFGFSNGAYYATSLAMRGRLPVDGYAAFAGGSGARYLQRAGAQTKLRAPVFVGWGGKDPAHQDQVALAKMLRRLKWPSRSLGKPRAGHAMTDEQVDQAFAFLSGRRGGDKAPGRGRGAGSR
ncbi:alpha/beta hydrolase [Sorangium atrum]|uniref:Dienelactone hydrolase family protein n=1 Tax=Sorangium atrum TaxID=2995308 RepID=A0ABT5CHH0_9BACT|nr:dienelactone hydrolase family protein [Sorangium aterium]MDC0685894.1 dienelactone hydrolase family protein [Sorangium aterium]